ncbi:MAG TPA: mechanosensitive ion channel family protein [Methanosarcina sp.]|jgi:small-conductance mechanosensitive channel|nr:mechanosensitive ion channel family protein [Methanosarcina sp.]
MGFLIMDIDSLDFSLPASNGTVTLGSVLKFILILSFSTVFAKILTLYLRRYLKDRVSKDVGETILKILYYGTLTIVFISNLHLIGIKPSALLVAGGVTGIILGFASQNIVGNLISGFFLMVERPIKIGDQVQISDVSGFVTDIRIISTLIRTYDGLLVRIPNQQVFTTNITNIVGHPVRRFEYTIRIRYSDDANAAIFLIKDLVDKEPFALLNPSPSVFVNDFGDSWINISVRIWAPVNEWFGIKTRLLWKIKQTLEENGIVVPLPQRIVHIQADSKNPDEIIPEKEIESVLNYEGRFLA